MKRIACLFPGIGYTCDKPLLYYSWKMLKGLGWEVVPVRYSGFPDGVKGNAEKMRQCAQMALEQAEELLREIDWSEYAEILFIGKSVGTVVCAAYAKRRGLKCRQILFTPVEASFEFAARDSIGFTAPRIRGRIRRPLKKAAGSWIFRFMKQKTRIIPWKPATWTRISGKCGKS